MRRWLLTPLVASLFLVAFVESWAALVHAARTAGIPYPQPWPWMVDGFIVAMALMVVEADRTQRSRLVLWPRVGLVAATGLSVWVQVAYAPQGGEWLAAWSPMAVLFSFECLVWLTRPEVVRSDSERPNSTTSEPVPDPEPEPVPEARPRTTQDAPRRERPVVRGRPFTPEQMNQIRQWVTEQRSQRFMATQLGLDDNGRTRRLAPVVRQLKVESNGGGS